MPSAKLPLAPLGVQGVKNYCLLFEFEIAALRLSIVARTPAPNSRTLALDEGRAGDGAGGFFVENMNEEAILAFDYAIRASMDVLRYFVRDLAECESIASFSFVTSSVVRLLIFLVVSAALAFAQDTVMIGVASVSVFLARVSHFLLSSFSSN